MKNLRKYIALPEIVNLILFWLFAFLAFGISFAYLETAFRFLLIAIILIFGIGVTVLALKAARLSLQSKLEKARLDNIIASMTDGVIIYDENFEVAVFSGAAENIFNVNAKEVLGKKLTPESVRDERLAVLTKVVFQTLAPAVIRHTPEGVYPQVSDLSFGEPHMELRVITDRIKDEKGEPIGFLKIVHDQTREADILKSKNEFITVAAHQLRTPLSAINWAYQSLAKSALDASQKELVDTGIAAANNLLKIVEDLLNISKIEEGRFGYNFQQIDIIAFLQNILNQAALVAKEYNVNMYMEMPTEQSILIDADPEKIGLAISNLLENAIKYNVPNGQVVLSIEKKTDVPFVQINISDTGLGIPSEALDKLFTKFFRAENALTKETAGSGLGLYIVRNVIRRHGGQIWVESVVNRGTTFHFTLPTDSRLIPQREAIVHQ
jgi:signal transduction histidine kinase